MGYKNNCRFLSHDDAGLCCLVDGPCRRYKYFLPSIFKNPILSICKPNRKRYIKPNVWINPSLF